MPQNNNDLRCYPFLTAEILTWHSGKKQLELKYSLHINIYLKLANISHQKPGHTRTNKTVAAEPECFELRKGSFLFLTNTTFHFLDQRCGISLFKSHMVSL